METHCAELACSRTAQVSLGSLSLCRSHFIAHSYRRLDECHQQVKDRKHWNREAGDTLLEVLTQIASGATTLALDDKDLSGVERAQITDLLLYATDIAQPLRSSPRKRISLPVTMLVGALGQTRTVDATTIDIGRRGASLKCTAPLTDGELIMIKRPGGSDYAKARVKWQRAVDHERVVGIEILDCKDFWGDAAI